MAFLNHGFGIIVADDFEAISLEYITCHPSKDIIVSYSLRAHDNIFNLSEPLKQSLMVNPRGLENIISSDMRFFTLSLIENCKDVLVGDESWLERKRNKEPRLWQGDPLRGEDETAIRVAAPWFCKTIDAFGPERRPWSQRV